MKNVALCLLFSLQLLAAQTNSISQDTFKATKIKAELGDADAMMRLGGFYINGEGVKEDPVQGLQWIEKAADKGIVEAQMMAGVAYWNGLNVKMNEEKGVKLFQKAADEGEPGAFFYLGAAYDLGKGVKQDDGQSYKWTLVFKASGLGIIPKETSDVEGKLKTLASKMTPEQIAGAKEQAAEIIHRLSAKPRFHDSAQ